MKLFTVVHLDTVLFCVAFFSTVRTAIFSRPMKDSDQKPEVIRVKYPRPHFPEILLGMVIFTCLGLTWLAIFDPINRATALEIARLILQVLTGC